MTVSCLTPDSKGARCEFGHFPGTDNKQSCFFGAVDMLAVNPHQTTDTMGANARIRSTSLYINHAETCDQVNGA